MFFYIVQL